MTAHTNGDSPTPVARDDAAATVLVVDDDADQRALLTSLLGSHGFVVRTAADGGSALDALEAAEPDLVILDLGLPDVGGHDLLGAVRESTLSAIIVLSSRVGERDRVRALDSGADDYVVKPFLPNELVSRVRLRLRQRPPAPATHLVIDTAGREVQLHGEVVPLTAKEFDLLAHLASEPRRAFSRRELLEAVWASSPDWQDDATVTEHVHRLRRKIGSSRIATIRGVGYRFEPDADPAESHHTAG